MPFGYIGSMRTLPGRRDEVSAILTASPDGLRDAGCLYYLVGHDAEDPDLIRVTEVWQSEQHHTDSLQLPTTKDAIARAMPMLTGEFSGDRVSIVGGLGV